MEVCVVFLVFLWLWQENTPKRLRRGWVRRLLEEWLGHISVFINLWGHIYAVSLPFRRHAPPSLARRRPLVQQLPPSAGKLIGDRRVVITRQGVLHILSRSWWPRSVHFALFGGARRFLVLDCCKGSFVDGVCATRAVLSGAPSNRRVCIGFFQLVFNRMYLIVCSGLNLACSLRLSTDCDRLHSARRGSYLNAETHFCWLSLFVATINMFWVLR